MQENQASVTALLTAYSRAYHSINDSPKIFDDYLAKEFFTDEAFDEMGENIARSLPFFNPALAASNPDKEIAIDWLIKQMNGPATISRSRFNEDCLKKALEDGVEQYVILGAGLDSFAFRRSDLIRKLQVFEIDHQATQNFKRQRIAELGWKKPANLHFIPLDFTKEALAAELTNSSYNSSKMSFFSWLGVTLYLSRETVLGTLASIADIAPAGSPVVFDYIDEDALTEHASPKMKLIREIVMRAGEPMRCGFNPIALSSNLRVVGLTLKENLSPEDIQNRYFSDRADGYRSADHIHFAWARTAK
jgi:methyltransferase (TIGR00027 family)